MIKKLSLSLNVQNSLESMSLLCVRLKLKKYKDKRMNFILRAKEILVLWESSNDD